MMADTARFQSGTLPDTFIGAGHHGPDLIPNRPRRRVRTRTLASIVWGGIAREVTSEHGQPCDFCGVDWPVSVGMPAYTHPGIDISVVRGTPLHAAASGTVAFAGWSPRFYRPNQVHIVTPDGELHIYAHMWDVSPTLVAGSWVNRGDYLGTSGEQTAPGTMTPDGTGGHLHFEARRARDGIALDPEPILTAATPPGYVDTITTAPIVAPGDRLVVIGDGLRLRGGPGTDMDILRTLDPGTPLTVLSEPNPDEGYTWARVRLTDGAVGWLALEFCHHNPDSPEGFGPGDLIEIADHAVRFRTGPGTAAGIIREFTRGVTACITGPATKADGFTWYPIRLTTDEEGWVAGDFCDLRESGACARDARPATRANWPTASAIDERIRLSSHINGRISRLTGLGRVFLTLGERYGINPAIAVAIAQRECQLGADGSHLPEQLNNFAGLTAGPNAEDPGPCGAVFHGDRYWKVFCSPEDGIEGIFRLLDAPHFRAAGGRFDAVMRHYSPAFENPWDGPGSIWETFRTLGDELGVSITRETNIYA